MRHLSVNIGFITNSSSCIYHFPKEILDDIQVQAFIKAHEMQNGYVGSDLWHRALCSSFLVTTDQKQRAKNELSAEEYAEATAGSHVDPADTGVYLIYGDEYSSETHILCGILCGAAKRLGLGGGYVTDFN